MRSQEIPDVFLKMRLSRRPHSDQDVATELLWRSTAFLRSSSWRFYALPRRFHCAFTALTLRALRCHGVRTALSRRLHCADGVTSKKSMQISGTVTIRIQIQPSKPKREITTCVILKIVKIRENILSTE